MKRLQSRKNGLCGADSFVSEVFDSEKSLPLLDEAHALEFYAELDAEFKELEVTGYPQGISTKNEFQRWLNNNENKPNLIRQVLSPAVHKLGIKRAQFQHDNNPSIKESYKQALLSEFDQFVQFSCQAGNQPEAFRGLFFQIPAIKAEFKTLLAFDSNPPAQHQLHIAKTTLQKKWEQAENSLSNAYFSARAVVSKQGATTAQWADEIEFAALIDYWNLAYEKMEVLPKDLGESKHGESSLSQDAVSRQPRLLLHVSGARGEALQFGLPTLKILDDKAYGASAEDRSKTLSKTEARQLASRGIGAPVAREGGEYFQMNDMAESQLQGLLAENPSKTVILAAFAEDPTNSTQKTNVSQLMPAISQEEITLLHQKGLINKNGDFLAKIPDREARLQAVPDELMAKVLSHHQNTQNLTHLYVHNSDGHWNVGRSLVDASLVRSKAQASYRFPLRQSFENKQLSTLIQTLSTKEKLSGQDDKSFDELSKLLAAQETAEVKDTQNAIDERIAHYLSQGPRARSTPNDEKTQVRAAAHHVLKQYAQFFKSPTPAALSKTAASTSSTSGVKTGDGFEYTSLSRERSNSEAKPSRFST